MTDQAIKSSRRQIEAVKRLWAHANAEERQSRYTAMFLLSLYHGSKYPFALSSLHVLKQSLHEDCLAVLELDYFDDVLVHTGASDDDFETLAKKVQAGVRDSEQAISLSTRALIANNAIKSSVEALRMALTASDAADYGFQVQDTLQEALRATEYALRVAEGRA